MTTPSHPRPDRWRDVAPDDRAHDAAANEFWGDQADWSTPRERSTDHGHTNNDAPSGHDASAGRKIGRWRGLLGGARTSPNRTHTLDVGPQRATADILTHDQWPDLADDVFDDASDETWDERWENTSPPVSAPRSGVDPLLARFGGLAVIVTLLVPAFLGFTSDSDDSDTVRTASAPLQVPSPSDVDGSPPATATSDETIDAASGEPTTVSPLTTSPDTSAGASPGPTIAVTTPPTEPTVGAVELQALTAPSCPLDYEVVAGDFWIRLADESGTSLADLLDVNDATLDTALFPGRSICLPTGADIPAPPTTAPPTPTTIDPPSPRPASTATATTSPTRPAGTQPPATTRPRPATTPPAPPAPPSSPAEVQAIIRAVWPDELESRAIEIAQRESKFIPTARNSCCYGVFQMYWSVHKGWLAALGITTAEQLYDPALNARAALALYERSGGWGPWGG